MSAASHLAERVAGGSRAALSRAITLVESRRVDHAAQASELLAKLHPHASVQRTFRVGVSGLPGSGKSTLIERVGMHIATHTSARVAVLTVDPSSAVTKGSILGDKTRMPALATHPRAFVRPSPSAGMLGGLTRRTDEAVTLCEAAGYSVVFVETVGVGQSECAVANAVDVVVMLIAPGAGDDLQGSKRGALEMADFLVVNKADGARVADALATARDYKNAMSLSMAHAKQPAKVVLHSVVKRGEGGLKDPEGLPLDNVLGPGQLWQLLEKSRDRLWENDFLQQKRTRQREKWVWNEVLAEVEQRLRDDPHVKESLEAVYREMRHGRLTPRTASAQVVNTFLKGSRNADT